ncbi:Hypothetical protein FKW44_022885, partial [Caligus rogercresseyi]
NVAILMTLRNHYVNVTLNNLLSLYSSSVDPHRLLISKGSHSSVSRLLEEFRLKELREYVVKDKDWNPFLKPGSPSSKKTFSSINHGRRTFEGRDSIIVSDESELLDGLDDDSLFGDF